MVCMAPYNTRPDMPPSVSVAMPFEAPPRRHVA